MAATRGVRLGVALAAAIVVAGAMARAQDQTTEAAVTAVIAQPLSPGTVAQFVQYAPDPRVQKRLGEALADADPAVRTVAARVAFATLSKLQVSALVRALAKETDPDAGAEEIRALVTLLGPPVDEQALAAVTRLGRPAATTMATVLARRSATDLLQHLPALERSTNAGLVFPDALAIATVQHPDDAAAIAQAVLKEPEWVWGRYLTGVRENAGHVDEAALLQGLRSESERIRTDSVWYVAQAVLDGDGFSDDVLKTVAPTPLPAGVKGDALTWEAFGREILSRVQGHDSSSSDWAGLLAARTWTRSWSFPAEAYSYLTKPEIAAMGIVRNDKQAGLLKRTMRTGRRELREVRARATTMRTFQAFAPGLIADLMKVTGCRATPDGRFVAGQVTYRPDGRPKSIELIDAGLSKECQQAGRVATMLTVASDDQPVEQSLVEQVLFLFDREFMACADAPRVPRMAGTYTAAVMKKEVPYEYPAAARRLQLFGVVRLAAVVSHTGCISYVETLRSLHPLFDLATIQAFKQWKYAPATVDGKPVESVVTVAFEVPLP